MKPVFEYSSAALLLLLFIGLAATSAAKKSATVDEFAHLGAGVYAWQTGDFSLYGKTPPLGRMLATCPAHLSGPELPGAPDHHEPIAAGVRTFAITSLLALPPPRSLTQSRTSGFSRCHFSGIRGHHSPVLLG